MRDDQRADREKPEDIDERFDEALDDLFGPDDEPVTVPPPTTGQEPQPPAGTTPPPHVFTPDPQHTHHAEHPAHRPHQIDDEHFFGPGNEPPPESYGSRSRISPVPAGQDEPPPLLAGDSGSVVTPAPQGRNWRKIGCYGCLVLVGIPTLCLGALIVLGLIVGEDAGTATPAAEAGDAPVPVSRGALAEPYATVFAGRPPAEIYIDAEGPFGSPERPVPLGFGGELGDGWVIRIDAVIENANSLVAAKYAFNLPPREGEQYVMARVIATNNTGAAASFDAGFRLRLAGGATGSHYKAFGLVERCGVIPDGFPNDLIDPGTSARGTVCWRVLDEDLGDLVLYNENSSAQDAAIWFAVTGPGTLAGAP